MGDVPFENLLPLGRNKAFRLTDDRGMVILTVPFADALHAEDRHVAQTAQEKASSKSNGKD
jgi:hypothetical protein